MDRNGDSISENTGGIASFSCILPKTTKHFLAKFPAEDWRPGDCVITNDPWLATGHLPDFTVVSPIFHRGALVAFAGSIAHSPDVGGASGPPIAARCSRKACAFHRCGCCGRARGTRP